MSLERERRMSCRLVLGQWKMSRSFFHAVI
jgi:hypothetical protein